MDWQDISTAPKDGTVIDLWGTNHIGEPRRFANCRWSDIWGDEGLWEIEYAEMCGSFTPVGDERYSFTHWKYPDPPPHKQGEG